VRRLILALCLTAPALVACDPAPKGVDGQKLSDAVASAVGDPSTCVLLVHRQTGKLVFRYGEISACARPLPTCGPEGGTINVDNLARLAAQGDDRAISCDSSPDGLRRVGWATGPVTPGPGAQYGELVYAAMMEGEDALPGREIKARLEPALRRGGM
jgi:hypothetical protein